ncbi:hypothetical protein [Acinetobacter sp. P1(2025)]|uniref:hypothetical protein n=1 Tax=Acinetobacter sp. P1(2025) TaxID=3446120 RepID=UPI003F534A49
MVTLNNQQTIQYLRLLDGELGKNLITKNTTDADIERNLIKLQTDAISRSFILDLASTRQDLRAYRNDLLKPIYVYRRCYFKKDRVPREFLALTKHPIYSSLNARHINNVSSKRMVEFYDPLYLNDHWSIHYVAKFDTLEEARAALPKFINEEDGEVLITSDHDFYIDTMSFDLIGLSENIIDALYDYIESYSVINNKLSYLDELEEYKKIMPF